MLPIDFSMLWILRKASQMVSTRLFLLVCPGLHYYHNHKWPWHINSLRLTCLGRLQSGFWNPLSWRSMGLLLWKINVSSLFKCLGKSLCLLQVSTLILPIFYWRFLRSWYICPKAIAIPDGMYFTNCLLLRTGHIRKFPF